MTDIDMHYSGSASLRKPESLEKHRREMQESLRALKRKRQAIDDEITRLHSAIEVLGPESGQYTT